MTTPTIPVCFSCSTELHLPHGPVGRSATCDACGADVRCCLNCTFYDTSCYNECREPVAERVVNKDRGNFCDFFRLRIGKAVDDTSEKESALKKLDDLFK
jgi:hypothetical protein